MSKKKNSTFLKLIIMSVAVFLTAVLFLNISTLFALKKIKNGGYIKSGYACAIVGSGSMERAIFVNDLILIKGSSSYNKEEIATYVTENGTLITHRVKDVTDKGYIMQGDANNTSDGEISPQRFMGRVVFVIPGIGIIIRALLSPFGLFFSIAFPLGIVLFLSPGQKREDDEERVSE